MDFYTSEAKVGYISYEGNPMKFIDVSLDRPMWINYCDAVSKALGRLSTTFIELYTLVKLSTVRFVKIICAGFAAERFRGMGAKGWRNRTRDCRKAVSRAIHLVNSHPELASASP
jgi:hypothetical protein